METYLQQINKALFKACQEDESVYVFGEDIIDPYGGAFKATKGLSTTFPERVISTPISEAAMTGVAGGMALRGLRPVLEIMFGDFLLLCMDQIVNYITKFKYMYGNTDLKVPMVIRTPMGAGKGYGPTHSQSLEKYFLGIPGITVVSPSIFHDVETLLVKSIECDEPVLFIENKRIYPKKIIKNDSNGVFRKVIHEEKDFPIIELFNNEKNKIDILIISYGGISGHILEVLRELYNEEIYVACLLPSHLNEIAASVFNSYLEKTKYGCIIIEESTAGFSWSSEVIACLTENFGVSVPIKRIAVDSAVVPASKSLESEVIPGKNKIIFETYKLMEI